MGQACSAKDTNEAKTQNTNSNKNRRGRAVRTYGNQVPGPQQHMPAQNADYQNNGYQNVGYQNDGYQNHGFQNMDYRRRANDIDSSNPQYYAYPPAPPPTPVINQNYPRSVNNIGNGNPDYNAYGTAYPPTGTNQNYPMNQQENVAATADRQTGGVPNSGFQRNAGMTGHPNTGAMAHGGYQDGGYHVMNQRRDINSYGPQTEARFLHSNQNVGYKGNEMQIQDAPTQTNRVKRSEPRLDAGIGDVAGDYRADNTQVINDGTINYESHNYQEESAAMTGSYQHNNLNVGYKNIGSDMAVLPTSSPCNCDVIDPAGPGRKGLGVKVYDPLVKTFVYEVDNFPLNGTVGSTIQPQVTSLNPVKIRQETAVNHTKPDQSKYGVITSPRRN